MNRAEIHAKLWSLEDERRRAELEVARCNREIRALLDQIAAARSLAAQPKAEITDEEIDLWAGELVCG